MPKRSKGRSFKGTPAWERAEKSEELAESAIVCEPPSSYAKFCNFTSKNTEHLTKDNF